MIVTTGKIIKIYVLDYLMNRDAESPGIVTVHHGKKVDQSIVLPANEKDMEAFIAAYKRICAENIEYRKKENE